MLFDIEPAKDIYNQDLFYVKEDYSFDMDPVILNVNFTILLNNLHLSVNNFNYVCQIWGFCPSSSWVATDKSVPNNYYGKLRVILDSELENSYAENNIDFAINKNDWPIFFNENTNSICVGNKNSRSPTVQFIKNCFAVINHYGQLEALWLTPQFIERID